MRITVLSRIFPSKSSSQKTPIREGSYLDNASNLIAGSVAVCHIGAIATDIGLAF